MKKGKWAFGGIVLAAILFMAWDVYNNATAVLPSRMLNRAEVYVKVRADSLSGREEVIHAKLPEKDAMVVRRWLNACRWEIAPESTADNVTIVMQEVFYLMIGGKPVYLFGVDTRGYPACITKTSDSGSYAGDWYRSSTPPQELTQQVLAIGQENNRYFIYDDTVNGFRLKLPRYITKYMTIDKVDRQWPVVARVCAPERQVETIATIEIWSEEQWNKTQGTVSLLGQRENLMFVLNYPQEEIPEKDEKGNNNWTAYYINLMKRQKTIFEVQPN